MSRSWIRAREVLRAAFGPRGADVLQLLEAMAVASAQAVQRLHAASEVSDDSAIRELRAAAQLAREQRRSLSETVAGALVLPFDPEEVLELSERIEGIVATAYRLQREAVLLEATQGPELQQMLATAGGMAELTARAVAALRSSPRDAQRLAEDVLDHRWDAEAAYGAVIRARRRSDRAGGEGPAQRELARLADALIEQVAHTARRVVHAVAQRG